MWRSTKENPVEHLYDGAFCENSQRIKVVNCFRKSSILDVWLGSEDISVLYF